MEENTVVTTNEAEAKATETPDVQTLIDQAIAETEARVRAESKKTIDKLSGEIAAKKREERARMSEEERAKAEQTEEYERLKEKAEADARELNHLKAVTAYKSIEEEVVEKLIDAINDKDHSAIAGLIDKVVERAIKEKEAEWKKSRPSAIVGDGSFPTMSKAEIMAIKDPVERQKKIAENLSLFT